MQVVIDPVYRPWHLATLRRLIRSHDLVMANTMPHYI